MENTLNYKCRSVCLCIHKTSIISADGKCKTNTQNGMARASQGSVKLTGYEKADKIIEKKAKICDTQRCISSSLINENCWTLREL